MVIGPADSTEHERLNESVEELRLRLNAMKEMMNKEGGESGPNINRVPKKNNRESIIDGSFLSCVFIIVLILIIFVSAYAFYNLFSAVIKKFYGNKKHTEL